MSAIHVRPIGPKHPWTSFDIDWQFDDEETGLTDAQRQNLDLISLLSCGGLKGFTRSIRHDLIERQQNRFLRLAFALGVLWLVFWFV